MQISGGNITEAQRNEFQQQLLDDEIRALAVTQYATKAGFRVTTEQLSRAFLSEPSFQVDGKFSRDEARSRLAQAGMSEQAYYEDLKRSLLVNQLLGSVGMSDFFTTTELKRVLSLLDEEREVRYVMLEPLDFAGAAPDAAAIEAYYKAHGDDFIAARIRAAGLRRNVPCRRGCSRAGSPMQCSANAMRATRQST